MNRLVVNIKDDLTKLNLGKLGKVEWDILMAVLHIINRHADQVRKIGLSEIKKLAGIKYDNNKYRDAVETLQGHLADLQMIDRQEGKIISAPFKMFERFEITGDTLNVKVSGDALYMFGTKYYGTPTGGFSGGNYIHIDLADFFALKSKHDKYMYLVLTEWARTGTAQVDLDVFAHRIGQPEMKWNRLLGNVLQPAIDHLGGHYLVCDMGRKKSEWKDELGQLEINYYKIDRATGEIIEPKEKEPEEKPTPEPIKEPKTAEEIEDPFADDPLYQGEINLSTPEGWAEFMRKTPAAKLEKPAEEPKNNVINFNDYIRAEDLQAMEAYYKPPVDYLISLLN